ncbi:hypothetical protein BH23ACT9_BH23ACT9_29710 [soil metagenome]
MRARIIATLSAAALLTLGLPGVASATCTEVIDETGCFEHVVCAAAGLVKQVNCIE